MYIRKKLTKAALGLLGDVFTKKDADMYLPGWICGLGIACVIGGAVFGIMCGVNGLYRYIAVGVLVVLLGVLAIMCHRNQKIFILNDEEFVYSTFLGNKYRLRFDELETAGQNRDSISLVFAGRKVHIENKAHVSARLAERLNEQLAKK